MHQRRSEDVITAITRPKLIIMDPETRGAEDGFRTAVIRHCSPFLNSLLFLSLPLLQPSHAVLFLFSLFKSRTHRATSCTMHGFRGTYAYTNVSGFFVFFFFIYSFAVWSRYVHGPAERTQQALNGYAMQNESTDKNSMVMFHRCLFFLFFGRTASAVILLGSSATVLYLFGTVATRII